MEATPYTHFQEARQCVHSNILNIKIHTHILIRIVELPYPRATGVLRRSVCTERDTHTQHTYRHAHNTHTARRIPNIKMPKL